MICGRVKCLALTFQGLYCQQVIDFEFIQFFLILRLCCVVQSLKVQMMDSVLLVRVLFYVVPVEGVMIVGLDKLRDSYEEN